jgi:hypothetical protein
MKTQAWGWLVAGVVALGANGLYHDAGINWAHRVADQARYKAEAFMSGQGGQLLAMAKLFATRNETAAAQIENAVAQVQNHVAQPQAGFAHLQAMAAREQSACARLEAGRARMEAQQARMEAQQARMEARLEARMTAHMRVPADHFLPVDMKIPVVCPRLRINVPRVPPRVPMVRIPVVHVDAVNAGPV